MISVWFNADLYALLEECDAIPNHCIAPTLQERRCKIKIEHHDLAEIAILRQQAERLPDGPERDEKISHFILLHCCEKHHRDKLNGDRSGCLERLVKRYGDDMDMLAPVEAEEEESSTLSPRNNESPRRSSSNDQSSPLSLYNGESSIRTRQSSITSDSQSQFEAPNHAGGIRLRSGRIVAALPKVETKFRRNMNYFVPYKTNPRESLRSLLHDPVPYSQKKSGVIYSFIWPSYPGFVKIGFSAHSAEIRWETWRICHKGLEPSETASVQYPHRIERLIHMQLAQYRRKIPNCPFCTEDARKTHKEWFERPEWEIRQVIRDWVDLLHREPLYNEHRQLSPKWAQIIQNLEGDITARALLDKYDAETALAAEIQTTSEQDIQTTLEQDIQTTFEQDIQTTLEQDIQIALEQSLQLEQDIQAAIELSLQFEHDIDTTLEQALEATLHPVVQREFIAETDDITLLESIQGLSTADLEATNTANAAWEQELLAAAANEPEPVQPTEIAQTPALVPEAIEVHANTVTTQEPESRSSGHEVQQATESIPAPTQIEPFIVPVAELAGQAVTTALQILQQQDQMLTYFEDFMTLLMAQSEDFGVGASDMPHVEPPAADLPPTETASHTIPVSAA